MTRHYILLIYLLLLVPVVTRAQSFRFSILPSVPVTGPGGSLGNAWAGGLNAPQFSKMDADYDGTEDLVVFDRSTQKVSVFLAAENGTALSYHYAPQFDALFPGMQFWMLLADYDNDGRKDIFTWADGGIQVYHQKTTGTLPGWEPNAELLMTTSASGPVNLYVPAADVPAITDIDNDGDLDLLVADPSGHAIAFHQNVSMDKYQHARNLEFIQQSSCWGKIEIGEECGALLLGVDCQGYAGDHQASPSGRVKHSGSALLALDLNGNDKKDLLLSNVVCDQLVGLLNSDTARQARIDSYIFPFPETRPVDLRAFPAAFYEDIDGDGKKDLLAAPNVSQNEGNRIDFRQSAWLYRNTGTSSTPAFTYQQADFLQNTMIDVGENAFPALADYDADGDLDLFVGHRGNPSGSGRLAAGIHLFQNTGTALSPAFQWVTDDFMGLSSLQATDLKPLFADLNRDGAPDLILANTYNRGLNSDLKYWLNEAPPRSAFQFTPGTFRTISVSMRPTDTPFLYDLDSDGDLDLLSGKIFGQLFYYRNTGNASNPIFTLQTEYFAGFPRTTSDFNQAPLLADLDGNGKPELLVGNRNGKLQIVADATSDPGDNPDIIEEVILDSLGGKFSALSLGGTITLAAGDLTGDGLPDLVVGSGGGGLVLLKNILSGAASVETDKATLYPNPASRMVYVRAPEDGEIAFFNVLGQEVGSRYRVQAGRENEIAVLNWPAGMYLARIRTSAGTQLIKFLVTR